MRLLLPVLGIWPHIVLAVLAVACAIAGVRRGERL